MSPAPSGLSPVTLVTGASAGLGAEFARQCARRGEKVALIARRRDRLEALAKEIGPEAWVFDAELGPPGAAEALMARLAAAGLSVQSLINNAGFGGGGGFEQQDPERQRSMIDLNVRALTELSRLVLPAMLERGRGAILNVASTASFLPGPGSAVYFATKAYVLSFTEALHQEMKGRGIKVSALCPGPTATEFGIAAGFQGKALERFTADPVAVVAAGLVGLDRNRAVVVPGFANKAGATLPRLLPRGAVRRLVAAMRF